MNTGLKTPLRALRGLYAITPDWDDTDRLIRASRSALIGGAGVLQYRNKRANTALALSQCHALRDLTTEFGACFIVNDSHTLAIKVKAEGVHLGRDDGCTQDIAAIRREAQNDQFIVGISCYDDLSAATAAEMAGASYAAFGSFFPSPTKPLVARPPITLLSRARASLSVPIVAIGGITSDNASQLIDAGADAVAVISALFETQDITATAQHFSTLFSHHV